MSAQMYVRSSKDPWNKGKLVGQKSPLKLKEIWAIRIRLQLAHRLRDLALFNLAIDSKLRGCDLVALRVRDICHGNVIANRAIVMQKKTAQPVQFEVTDQTKAAVAEWIKLSGRRTEDFLFPSRVRNYNHISTRQYARIVRSWVMQIGLDPAAYATHSNAPDKSSAYLSADEESAGCSTASWAYKLESTVRYLGIEVDDALEIAEQTEV